ncbi:MAG: ABC transporter permease [Oscillospiraceae bacterium]|jgi:ribose transport system permease protein|nr:ABC transporter permease [Oscillospiraceae bacterium]
MGKDKKRSNILMNNKVAPLLLIMVVVVIFFWYMNPGYLGPSNILILLKSSSLTGILGVGVGMLLISGQVDLATGGEAGLAGVLTAIMLYHGWPWPAAVLTALVFGAAAGAFNSLMVNGLNMMAFIATIGLSSVLTGLANVVTRGSPVKFNNAAFVNIGATKLLNVVPLSFIIMAVLMIVYGLLLSQTKFGRSVYMCGGNRNAARLAGLNPKKIHTILFINCGVVSALGGVLYASNMRKGDPVPLTQGMDAITAAILGGISFTGGSGGMGGLFVGLMLLNSFNNGLTVVRLKSYWQIFAQGALLILALLFDFYRENQRLKMLKAGTAENQKGVS